MTPEIQKTITHCVEYATELLTETGESYPFGAFIDTIGNVHPLEMEIDKKKIPTIGQVIENLRNYCEDEMKANRMHGYALTYEVEMELEEGVKQDCIAIDIKHSEEELPMFYLPFKKGNDDNMEVGELFAVERSA